ncbi:hypothetical protein CSB45_09680 [candidate division KSB3 bacterium]|uniref:Uncharacterized protein n=1 Tax=candidate division KSB3 bacterium TaxID=2044937 RepID=A0A2G6E4L5_9BACT|nr:MAG: hypothetical protein CSB45_09680 [candidate division KSB3 bacterium]PIE29414.1 MAG: hypothetical protein CSA57_08395 [candidate division KSB3 bacterium]
MLTNEKIRLLVINLSRKRPGTNIAVSDPHVIGLDRREREHLVQQRPFLGMSVFTGEDLNREPELRLIDDERPGSGRPPVP